MHGKGSTRKGEGFSFIQQSALQHNLPQPFVAMDLVTALANVEVPESGTVPEVADRSDSERVAKWARTKERMLCYRCGEKGHFIAECVAELCEACGKPAHTYGDCPFLCDQAPALTMYGVYCAELMFFESRQRERFRRLRV